MSTHLKEYKPTGVMYELGKAKCGSVVVARVDTKKQHLVDVGTADTNKWSGIVEFEEAFVFDKKAVERLGHALLELADTMTDPPKPKPRKKKKTEKKKTEKTA